MHYLGGKKRIAKHIADYINLTANKAGLISIPNYYEPFCGMCSVGRLVYADNKYFSDIFKPVITFWNAIRNGWLPPEDLTEAEYKAIKERMDYNDPLTAFAGFGCSFTGCFFSTYAKDKRGDNYVKTARNFALEARNFALEARNFDCHSYLDINVSDSVIYLDPPYKGVGKLRHLKTSFDYDLFYSYCIDMAKDNAVYISEYSMPSDMFECVLEMPVKSTIDARIKKATERIEKLFVVK